MSTTLVEYTVLPVRALVSEIAKFRPCSVPSFYRYAKALGIKHAGFPTRPKLYHVADGERILHYIGFPDARINFTRALNLKGQPTPAQKRVPGLLTTPGRLVTPDQLRKERRKGRAAR